MSSILTNASALSALQALSATQSSLATVQNQVSTGLAVATAADNSAYWSIAAQLGQDSGIVKASNDALTQSQSILSTATSAIASITSTLNAMASALTQAQQPNASLTSINTSLVSLGQALTDAINNASFNGANLLNGTITTTLSDGATTGVQFVSGYQATSTGGAVQTIGMATQSLYTSAGVATTDLLNQTVTKAEMDATPAYKQYDANTKVGTALDLTKFTGGASGTITDASDAAVYSVAVNQALTAVTSYAATIGATQNRMTAASTFNTALQTDYTNGISGLVDADMNEASTRLQALQTQEQLGIQSLSVANQNAQLILKLFSS